MKQLLSFIVAFFLFLHAFSQGQLKESLDIQSRILGQPVRYSIYLPDGYENGNRRYPVLYLLHGYSDNETGWTQYGEVEHTISKSIESGDATKMIIVMADAKVTWYMNDYAGKTKFEDFYIKEFIPFIDSSYRTRASKQFRAIAGLSMGGYGSLLYATKYPELFAACAPLSAAVWTDEEFINMEQKSYSTYFGDLLGRDLKGKERVGPHFRKNSILDIIGNTDPEKLKSVRYYIDCGDDDFLIKGNMALHALMIDKKIPHEFRVRDGGHTWNYWRTALPEVFKFVTQSFHR